MPHSPIDEDILQVIFKMTLYARVHDVTTATYHISIRLALALHLWTDCLAEVYICTLNLLIQDAMRVLHLSIIRATSFGNRCDRYWSAYGCGYSHWMRYIRHVGS